MTPEQRAEAYRLVIETERRRQPVRAVVRDAAAGVGLLATGAAVAALATPLDEVARGLLALATASVLLALWLTFDYLFFADLIARYDAGRNEKP